MQSAYLWSCTANFLEKGTSHVKFVCACWLRQQPLCLGGTGGVRGGTRRLVCLVTKNTASRSNSTQLWYCVFAGEVLPHFSRQLFLSERKHPEKMPNILYCKGASQSAPARYTSLSLYILPCFCYLYWSRLLLCSRSIRRTWNTRRSQGKVELSLPGRTDLWWLQTYPETGSRPRGWPVGKLWLHPKCKMKYVLPYRTAGHVFGG